MTPRRSPARLGGGVQHAPRALPGQAAAAGVQEHRRARPTPGRDAAARAGLARTRYACSAAHGVAADRDHPVLAALAGQPHHGVLRPAAARRRRARSPRRCARRSRRGTPAAPGPAAAAGPPRPVVGAGSGRVEQALHLRQGDRLGQPPGRRRAAGRRGPDRRRPGPGATANACSPRTAITARAAELTASAACSASPSRSEARNSATSAGVTSPSPALPAAGEYRRVPAQVPPVGLHRVRRQARAPPPGAAGSPGWRRPASRRRHAYGTGAGSEDLGERGVGQGVRFGDRLAGQLAGVGVQAQGQRRVGAQRVAPAPVGDLDARRAGSRWSARRWRCAAPRPACSPRSRTASRAPGRWGRRAWWGGSPRSSRPGRWRCRPAPRRASSGPPARR